MRAAEVSRTALTACAARAAHLIVDREPVIFADPLAAAVLGDRAEELIAYHRLHGTHLILASARTQVTCRARYAERRLADLAAGSPAGTWQYLILGAGLDTFAWRSDLAGAVAVFEADHPATQAWKREQLRAADIIAPPSLTFVPVDLSAPPPTLAPTPPAAPAPAGVLMGELRRAGLDPQRPVLVSWLGVTMYLAPEAIAATLAELALLAPGSELIFDYLLPAAQRDADGDLYAEQVGAAAARGGEPWLGELGPGRVADLLAEHGFTVAEDLAQRDWIELALWRRSDALRPIALTRLVRAIRGASATTAVPA